jgi:hypothetical protein
VSLCRAPLQQARYPFDVGYKAKFETTGTDVAVTFELLDQKDGVIAIYGESLLCRISDGKSGVRF